MCWASQNTLVDCSFSSNRGAVVFDGDVMWHFQCTHAYPCVAKDRKILVSFVAEAARWLPVRAHTCVCGRCRRTCVRIRSNRGQWTSVCLMIALSSSKRLNTLLCVARNCETSLAPAGTHMCVVEGQDALAEHSEPVR